MKKQRIITVIFPAASSRRSCCCWASAPPPPRRVSALGVAALPLHQDRGPTDLRGWSRGAASPSGPASGRVLLREERR